MSFNVKYCFLQHLIHIKFEFLLHFALTSICHILYWKFHHLQFVAHPRTLIIYLSFTEFSMSILNNMNQLTDQMLITSAQVNTKNIQKYTHP